MNISNLSYYTVRPAKALDAYAVSSGLCGEDRLELERLQDADIYRIVLDSYLESAPAAWTALAPGERHAAMWGVTVHPALPDVGIPWVLKTEWALKRPSEFMRISRFFNAGFGRQFKYLANYVDASYGTSIRWMKRLGFTEGETETSARGYPFVCMWRKTHVRR